LVFRRSQLIRWAAGLVVFVFAVDLGWSLVSSGDSGFVYGILDLPLHFATAAVFLMAVIAWRRERLSPEFVVAALVASVALDLDHVPGYLGSDALSGGDPRPYSHSLATIVVLLLCAWALHGRGSALSLGAAFGVSAHLVRDLATGPGVPLVWPASSAAIAYPYLVFAAALVLAGGIAAAGEMRRPSSSGAPRRRGSRTRMPRPMES
jgi:inner membrane protein